MYFGNKIKKFLKNEIDQFGFREVYITACPTILSANSVESIEIHVKRAKCAAV